MLSHRLAILLLLCAPLYGCADDPPPDDDNNNNEGCSLRDQTGCAPGLVCEEVQGGTTGCFQPLTLLGRVFDALTDVGIEGARVIAKDPNDAALSRVSITDLDGTYNLVVNARRDSNGNPLKTDVTLRVDAAGYATFAKPPRVALPIDLSAASGNPPTLQSALTDVALIPLPNSAGLGSISGNVIFDPIDLGSPGGTLVVAGSSTGAADIDGSYVVFNVPTGSVTVSGYAQGINLTPVTTSVQADTETLGVDLIANAVATSVVSGKVEIVNPMGAGDTSVILVVEDTFEPITIRGESAKGLRAFPVSGEFSISGVPDGKYVVLAAFENDGLVRDPDTSIGGTEIVHITVAGADLALAENFKVTGALAVNSPGANTIDEVSGTPTFIWEDDSSEDGYEIRLFDALGTQVWEDLAVPSVSGSMTVERAYDGPALMPGMIYQFRSVSIKSGVPISSTEDLRGVFVYR